MPVFRRRGIVAVRPEFCIYLSVLLLLLPLKWVLAWFVAALVHEFGHYLAVKLCGIPISAVTLEMRGVYIKTGLMTPGQELFCALSGPLLGFALVAFAHIAPAVAVCALFHTASNLLPIGDFDGGRALRCLLELVFPAADSGRVQAILDWIIIGVVVTGVGILTNALRLWPLPMAVGILLILRCGKIKFPCKESIQIVQ